jgi:hypothetical protein
MSITDQKRREVAATLRCAVVSDMETDIYVEQLEQDSAALDRIVESVSGAGYVHYLRLHSASYRSKRRYLLDVLADLIDRPTCHDVSRRGGVFACSACGAQVDIDCTCGEPLMWLNGVAITPRYCPNCGAEVIGWARS